jgi:glycerophosphoryl diester phosphodiesterase
MKKDWLIAHRGAQCDGRENTLAAYKSTKKYPLGWVELDVHTTKDGVVICHHDFDVNGLDIDLHNFVELKNADPELITFGEAIRALGETPLIVEVKPTGTAKNIVKQLKTHPGWRITTFKLAIIKELLELGLDPKRLYLMQHKRHNTGLIGNAKSLGLGGIAVNQRLLTPSMYLRALSNNLRIYTYTVNTPLQAKIFRKLYPKLSICTDRPDLLQKLT